MIAPLALIEARAAGIEVRLKGDGLALRGKRGAVDAIRPLLVGDRPAIIRFLRGDAAPWSTEDWQAHYLEREAIAGEDGEQPEAAARANAFEACVVEWLDRTTLPSPPGCCAACGKDDPDGVNLNAHLAREGHVWLHDRCWAPWQEQRRTEAEAFLATVNITRDGVREVADESA